MKLINLFLNLGRSIYSSYRVQSGFIRKLLQRRIWSFFSFSFFTKSYEDLKLWEEESEFRCFFSHFRPNFLQFFQNFLSKKLGWNWCPTLICHSKREIKHTLQFFVLTPILVGREVYILKWVFCSVKFGWPIYSL